MNERLYLAAWCVALGAATATVIADAALLVYLARGVKNKTRRAPAR